MRLLPVLGIAGCSLASCYFAGTPGKGHTAELGYQAATPVIAALGSFRRDHGYYPAKLQQLVPHYVPDITVVQFRRGHLQGFEYQREGDAYTLTFVYYGAAANQCSYDSKKKKWDCLGYF
jgi:hypothetical protein